MRRPTALGRGIIPACAGSTGERFGAGDPRRDHPRMCGEHTLIARQALLGVGSSPHVRGAQSHRPSRKHDAGIIPACAGST